MKEISKKNAFSSKSVLNLGVAISKKKKFLQYIPVHQC
jgi:hypothetical protein